MGKMGRGCIARMKGRGSLQNQLSFAKREKGKKPLDYHH
jgi:hypothetical protein